MMIKTLLINSEVQNQFIDITQMVQNEVNKAGINNGLCYCFVPHTTAGITINENADPDVCKDILMGLNTFVPVVADYRHMEGNSAAHIKASLMGFSQVVYIQDGNLALGTWQGIYYCEFDGPRNRRLIVKMISED